jgi:hypothetical protein
MKTSASIRNDNCNPAPLLFVEFRIEPIIKDIKDSKINLVYILRKKLELSGKKH